MAAVGIVFAIALAIEEELRLGGGGGRRAIVDRHGALLVRKVDKHEAAATEIARPWERHRQGKGGRNCGVHCIAAPRHDPGPDPARELVLADDHGLVVHHRVVDGVVVEQFLLRGRRGISHRRHAQGERRKSGEDRLHRSTPGLGCEQLFHVAKCLEL